jgi:hypothetical protein
MNDETVKNTPFDPVLTHEECEKMKEEGFSLNEVRQGGYNIKNWFKKAKRERHPDYPDAVEDRPRRSLTASQVVEVLHLRKRGWSYKKLALKFECNRGIIVRIVKNNGYTSL